MPFHTSLTFPSELGYTFPAEWEPHRATWLSWPHNPDTWPGKIEAIYPSYCEFVRLLAEQEEVHLNVSGEDMEAQARRRLEAAGVVMDQVFFHHFPTNDAWCRDHGPAFVTNPRTGHPLALVDWQYNGWGRKYPSQLDNRIPEQVAEFRDIPSFKCRIVMEGGAIDVNGAGALITTRACLLHPNRNPELNQRQIEAFLQTYYGQEHVIWLQDGIVGDDTDGHVDDLTRFVDHRTVVTMIEHRRTDANYEVLQENRRLLRHAFLPHGYTLDVIEIPMPDPVVYEGQRLPASYANFYVANKLVIVPTYGCAQDQEALGILADCFPERRVVGLDSTDLIWGLGSFHCLSQQEPLVIPEEL